MPYFLNNSTFAISSSIKGGWVVNLRNRYNKFLELILLAINYCLEKQKFYFFYYIFIQTSLRGNKQSKNDHDHSAPLCTLSF